MVLKSKKKQKMENLISRQNFNKQIIVKKFGVLQPPRVKDIACIVLETCERFVDNRENRH